MMNGRPQERLIYETASEKLIEFVPELNEAYRRELDWWGSETPGPHVIYEDILNPYVDRLLESGDDAALRRVFNFIELLATAEDARLHDLVAVALLESLAADGLRTRQARQYMGPATRTILRKVQKH